MGWVKGKGAVTSINDPAYFICSDPLCGKGMGCYPVFGYGLRREILPRPSVNLSSMEVAKTAPIGKVERGEGASLPVAALCDPRGDAVTQDRLPSRQMRLRLPEPLEREGGMGAGRGMHGVRSPSGRFWEWADPSDGQKTRAHSGLTCLVEGFGLGTPVSPIRTAPNDGWSRSGAEEGSGERARYIHRSECEGA
jgi:hypothetical protein